MTMRTFVVASTTIIVCCAFLKPLVISNEPNEVAVFMRPKLKHSQGVLEGLTTENYEMIAKHSQEMSLLSQASNWQVLQTVEYRERSTEFRRSVDALTEAAKKRQLDTAALAYVDVTLKCVSCHKYVRTVGAGRAPAKK
jgi:hypothetical protein